MGRVVTTAEYLDCDDFPEHIKHLVQREKESEEQEKRQREIERNTCKVHPPPEDFPMGNGVGHFTECSSVVFHRGCIVVNCSVFLCQIKLFCMHPVKMMAMMENKLEVHKDKTLREATEMAYKVRQSGS